MILIITKVLGYLLLGLLALICSRELAFFIKAYRYTKQGIQQKYTPVIGFASFMLATELKNQLEAYLELFKNEEKEGETVDILVANSPSVFGPVLFLNDKDLLAEFAKIETSVSQKIDTIKMPTTDSFLYQYGKRAIDNRSVYHEIFYASNLK